MRAILFAVAAAAILSAALALPVAEVGGSKACAVCQLVLTDAAALMKGRGFTEQGFEQGLDTLCSQLPPTGAKDCQAFVALFGEDIFRALDGDIPADQVCSLLRLCNNSTTEADVLEQPAAIASDDGDDGSEDSSAEDSADESNVEGTKACAICELVLKLVESYFHTAGMNEQQFEQDLDNLCSRLPVKVQPECKALVVLYGDQIWQALDGDVPPAQVCAEIRICANTSITADIVPPMMPGPVMLPAPGATNKRVIGRPVVAVLAAKAAAAAAAAAKSAGVQLAGVKGSKACAICELVLQYAASFIKDESITEQGFEQKLDALCGDLPASIQPECKALVVLYGDDIWRALDGDIPPPQVCTELHICNNSTMPAY